ncbi:hypothetical protein BIWAKO_05793 [Bosea sp. BIWAKO-01]|nr:hypothetical protein BIWAKO_05793 [Bosea sp. BIWAKO-01]
MPTGKPVMQRARAVAAGHLKACAVWTAAKAIQTARPDQ